MRDATPEQAADTIREKRYGDDYIDRTIATVRNHRDADNCWPQWANIFADEIERLRVRAAAADNLAHAMHEVRRQCLEGHGDDLIAITAERSLAAYDAATAAHRVVKTWHDGGMCTGALCSCGWEGLLVEHERHATVAGDNT